MRWRAVGARDRMMVRACAACAEAVRAQNDPDVLLDGATRTTTWVPERSVCAATGYGQLRGDLIERALRGDLGRTRPEPN